MVSDWARREIRDLVVGVPSFLTMRSIALLSVLLSVASGLLINPARKQQALQQRVGRRAAAGLLGAAAFAGPLAATANTQPMLDKPMEAFDADELRRRQFKEKQKIFKKAWRKQLANLEFSTNDAEATEAIKALGKLIADNGYEVPEGIRKMDLDQVYKTVQGNLQKETRMEFKSLDALVLKVTSTKQMGSDFDLGDMGRI